MSSISCIEQQLEELEALNAVYGDSCCVDAELVKILSSTKVNTDKKPQLQFSIEFELSSAQTNCKYQLLFKLSKNYPSGDCNNNKNNCIVARIVTQKSNDFDNKTIERVNKLIQSEIPKFDLSNQVLFELIDTLNEKIETILITSQKEKEEKQKMCQKIANGNNSIILRRSFIWFHHIYSSKKKQTIRNLSMKWKIHGFCITGKPGFIVAEGVDYNVKQCVSHLKSLHWQRMIVRHSEIESYNDAQTFAMNECFAKWHFFDYPRGIKGGMKQLNACLTKGNGICNDNGKDLSKYFQLIAQIDRSIDNCQFDQSIDDNNNNSDDEDGDGDNNDNVNNDELESKTSPRDKQTMKKNQINFLSQVKSSNIQKTNGKGKNKNKSKNSNNENDNNNNNNSNDNKKLFLLKARITPNAKADSIVDITNDIKNGSNELNIRISQPARNNAANEQLCQFIAQLCHIKKSDVLLKSGHKSRTKTLEIDVSNVSHLSNVEDIVAKLTASK